MNDMVQIAEDFFKSLGSLSPDMFAGCGVLAVIFLIKIVPFISPKYYGLLSVLSGPILYIIVYTNLRPAEGIGNAGSVPLNIERPWTRQIIMGLIVGVVAWNFYEKILVRAEKVLAKKFPWLGQFLDTPAQVVPLALSPKEETAFIKAETEIAKEKGSKS